MKASFIIAEDAQGNLSVPVIDKDKNAVLSVLPEILRQGYTAAHFVKNPTARTFKNKALKVHPLMNTDELAAEAEAAIAENNAAYAEQDDVADALSDTPKRRGRPPKSIL